MNLKGSFKAQSGISLITLVITIIVIIILASIAIISGFDTPDKATLAKFTDGPISIANCSSKYPKPLTSTSSLSTPAT